MSCDAQTIFDELRAAYEAKAAECSCSDPGINWASLCGDGGGLLPELVAAVDAWLAAGCVQQGDAPRPSMPECLTGEYLQGLIDWINDLYCEEEDTDRSCTAYARLKSVHAGYKQERIVIPDNFGIGWSDWKYSHGIHFSETPVYFDQARTFAPGTL